MKYKGPSEMKGPRYIILHQTTHNDAARVSVGNTALQLVSIINTSHFNMKINSTDIVP